MTYQEFKNKYNGKYVDTDGYPKDWKWQCYDLAQLYFQEVLGVPYDVLQGCKLVKNMILWDWKYNMLLKYFDEVDVGHMQQGDISIWTSGEGGHIAIFDYYNPSENLSYYFSQNPNPSRVIPIVMEGHHAFRKKSTAKKEAVDQILHAGSKVQIPGTFDVISVRKSDNTAVVRINGVDYRLSSTPLLEV